MDLNKVIKEVSQAAKDGVNISEDSENTYFLRLTYINLKHGIFELSTCSVPNDSLNSVSTGGTNCDKPCKPTDM